MKTKAIIYILISLWIFPTVSFCQVSQGGMPLSTIYGLREANTLRMDEVDVETLLKEDADIDEPIRFAVGHPLSINFFREATLDYLPTGEKVYRLAFYCPKALAIDITYTDFYLPEGCSLFLYDPNYETVLGAFTFINNKTDGNFATSITKGEITVLEYIEPANIQEEASIYIDKVFHVYKDIFNFYNEKSLNNSSYDTNSLTNSSNIETASCPVNVICDVAMPWRNESNSVVLLVRVDGTNQSSSSAFLVNNADDNINKQYLLTANHCVAYMWNTIPPVQNQWQVWFRYEETNFCDQILTANVSTVTGVTIHERWFDGIYVIDAAILEINEPIPANTAHSPHFIGWSSLNITPNKVTNSHHAASWVKRFNISNSNIVSAGDNWSVTWDLGAVRSGTSGSPLVQEDHYTVGIAVTRHSASIECPYPFWCDDLPYHDCKYWIGAKYVKLSTLWNLSGFVNGTTLKSYLDPNSTNQTTKVGISNFDMDVENLQFDNPDDDHYSGIFNTYGSINLSDVTVASTGVLNLRSGDEIIIDGEFSSDLGSEITAEVFVNALTKQSSNRIQNKNNNLSSKVTRYKLLPNSPNPFNPETKLSYVLAESNKINLSVFNILGEKVVELVNEYQESGKYTYSFNASNLPSGVYITTLTVGPSSVSQKMVLMK